MEIAFLTKGPLPTWVAVPTSPVRAVHLYLHGSGERGEDPERLTRWSLPGLIARGLDVPFMVVAPLCPYGGDWDDRAQVSAAELCLRAVSRGYDGLPLSISGFSTGARGVWRALESRALPYGRAPIVAGRVSLEPMRTPGERVQIRVIHGALDDHQDASAMADFCGRLRGRDCRVDYEAMPGAGHFIADEVYGRSAILDWLSGLSATAG